MPTCIVSSVAKVTTFVTDLELKLAAAAISSFKRYGDALPSPERARVVRSVPRAEGGSSDWSGAPRRASRSADQLLAPASPASSDAVAPKVKKTLSDRLKKIRKKAGLVVLYLDYGGSPPPKIRRASSAQIKASAKTKALRSEQGGGAASGGVASGGGTSSATPRPAGATARSAEEASPLGGAAPDARADGAGGADQLLLEQAFTVIEGALFISFICSILLFAHSILLFFSPSRSKVLCTSAAMCISTTGLYRPSEACSPSRSLAFRLIFSADKVSRSSAILPPIARIAPCSGAASPQWQLRAARLLARIVRMLGAAVSKSGLVRKLPTHPSWRGGDGWLNAQQPLLR